MMKKRWIAVYVENYPEVLAKIASLFSAKLYNLNSLTVGPTEDITMSRMTISVLCDDATFEQIKKTIKPICRSDKSNRFNYHVYSY